MRPHWKTIALLLCVAHAGVATEAHPQRLPVQAFRPQSSFLAPVFAPDGRSIALLIPDAETVVAVRPWDRADVQPIGRIPDANVQPRWLRWADPTRVLLSAEIASPGDPPHAHRVFAFELPGGAPPFAATAGTQVLHEAWDLPLQDEVIHWQRDEPTHALVQYRDPGQLYPGVKLMDVLSGQLTNILPSRRGIDLWYADHDGVIRAGVGFGQNRYRLVVRMDAAAGFQPIVDFDPSRETGFTFAGFGFDPATLYVWKLLDGRRALYEYNLASKHIVRLVFARPDVDVDGLVFNEGRRKLIAVDYIADEPKRQFLDEQAEREQQLIDDALPGTFNQVVSQNKAHTRAIVRVAGDTRPPAYYLFVRDDHSKRADLLTSLYPTLGPDQLAPTRVLSYRARDGLEIPAYLTIPNGRAPRNLPVIVRPHGGPMTRDCRQFDPEVQLLANRGFAVFQMNFRGSGGYGESYREMGFRQWGLAMQDDITDGVRWLIEQGIADPERIGIYGASYGGYAALMGLVKTPELYRAGAAYAAATNLPAFVAANPHMFAEHDRGGTAGAWNDTKAQQAVSPLHNVSRIQAPVLLAHGADDDRVPVAHARMMAQALREAGKDIEYLEFAHEPHGFIAEGDRVRFYERLLDFFETHLMTRTSGRNDVTGVPTTPGS
ncbi:MAG: Dipeptidyl aminopeptidase/acylaminoacyl peptidase [Deltaproteobacteria bacterium]|nr:Dipeptidyl aminopeptidase/acylaminoacyl peptidase [Deltaproteobacteria bacterium]